MGARCKKSAACMTSSTEEGPDSDADDSSFIEVELTFVNSVPEILEDPKRKPKKRHQNQGDNTEDAVAGQSKIIHRIKIDNLTPEKEAQVQSRSHRMKVISSYRRGGQRTQDKERNSQRAFKTHEQ